MAANDNKTVIEIGVSTKELDKGVRKAEKLQKRSMAAVTKESKKAAKAQRKMYKESIQDVKMLVGEVEELEDSYNDLAQTVSHLEDAYEKASESERKGMEGNLNILRKKLKQQEKSHKSGRRAGGGSSKKEKKAKEIEEAKKKAEAFLAPIEKFFAKDLKGLVENAFGIAARRVKDTLGKGVKWGRALEGMGERRKAEGKIGGGAMKAVGKGMAEGASKLLATISKLAPMLEMASSFIMAAVKLFIDADAAAKALNKEILQSASTSELFYKNARNADTAMGALESTMREVRDAAFDASFNLNLGIDKGTHTAVLNTLTQEGVTLRALRVEADASGKSLKAMEQDLVKISVGYSRGLGVPLQEINQVQAEMFSNLATNATEAGLAFHQMTRQANESGLAANKFFAMLRGASSDLSLWGTRLQDATIILGRLNKVMSPQGASKFFNAMVGGMKKLSIQDRLRMTAIVGKDKMASIIKKGMAPKIADLAKKLKMDVGDVGKILEKEGGKGLEDAISKLPEAQQGAMRESARHLGAASKGLKRGGMADVAAASKVGGPMELMKLQLAELKAVGKLPKDVNNFGDVMSHGMSQIVGAAIGITEEDIEGNAAMEDSLALQRSELGKKLDKLSDSDFENRTALVATLEKQLAEQEEIVKNGPASQKAAAKETITGLSDKLQTLHALSEAGADGVSSKAEAAAKLKEATDDQIFGSLTEAEGLAKKGVIEETDFYAAQGQLTQSLEEKLGVLVDFFLNQYYNLVMDLLDAVRNPLLGPSDEELNARAVKEAKARDLAAGVKDPEKAVQEALTTNMSGVIDKLSDSLTKRAGGGMGKTFEAAKAAGLSDEKLTALGKAQSIEGLDLAGVFKEAGFTPEEQAKVMKEAVKGISYGNMRAVQEGLKPTEVQGGPSPTTPAPAAGVRTGTTTVNQPEVPGTTDTMQSGGGMAGMFAKIQAAAAAQAAAKPMTEDQGAMVTQQLSSVQAATYETGAGTTQATYDAGGMVASSVDLSGQTLNEGLMANYDQLDAVQDKLDQVRFAPSFLRGPFSKEIQFAVLDSVRTALFEYYLYSQFTPDELMKTGADPKSIAMGMTDAFSKKMDKSSTLASLQPPATTATAPDNAAGGVVTGVGGGLAEVRAAAGEGLASIGKGEKIVPAGGGGGGGGGTNVNFTVNGIGGADLANFLKTKVNDAIYEYKSRERFN